MTTEKGSGNSRNTTRWTNRRVSIHPDVICLIRAVRKAEYHKLNPPMSSTSVSNSLRKLRLLGRRSKSMVRWVSYCRLQRESVDREYCKTPLPEAPIVSKL